MQSARSPILRLLAALAIVVGVSAAPVMQVSACSCMELSPEEAARAADVVFSGTAVAEEPMPMPMPMGGPGRPGVAVGAAEGVVLVDPAVAPIGGGTLYLFEVDGVAKGDVGPEMQVLAGGDGAGCGISFGINERWLVFGTIEGDVVTTGLCSGNTPLAPDEPPAIPVTSPGAAPAARGSGGVPTGVLAALGAVVALAGLSGYLFWRADRPS